MSYTVVSWSATGRKSDRSMVFLSAPVAMPSLTMLQTFQYLPMLWHVDVRQLPFLRLLRHSRPEAAFPQLRSM